MEIKDEVEIKIKGKVVKKELYRDKRIRVWIQNDETNEMAIVCEE